MKSRAFNVYVLSGLSVLYGSETDDERAGLLGRAPPPMGGNNEIGIGSSPYLNSARVR